MGIVGFEQDFSKILLRLKDRVHFLYLLGSFGTARMMPESDVDLAAFFDGAVSFKEISALSLALEDELGREVDLVSLNLIDPIFAFQVIATGRLMYLRSGSEQLHIYWRLQKMSEYFDFKQSRKIIEDNILVRKKYG